MPGGSSSSVRIFYPSFNRAELLQKLRTGIDQLKQSLPLIRVILFGSYAKNRATVASNIDLLVIYRGERREDAFAIVKKTISIPRLEPHVYSEAEYKSLRNTIDMMIADGIVLL